MLYTGSIRDDATGKASFTSAAKPKRCYKYSSRTFPRINLLQASLVATVAENILLMCRVDGTNPALLVIETTITDKFSGEEVP